MGQAAYQPAWPRTRPLRPSCSTARCCARGMDRARRGGPVTFLLDRVAEDLEERLQAVTRGFSDVAEIATPDELLRKPLADRFQSIARVDLDRSETLPLAAGITGSRRLRARVPVRQRSAGRAGADPPRAEAGRAVAGGDDRRRYADRAPAILCGGGSRMRRRRVAARRAVCRSARYRRAAAARGPCVAGHRRRSRRGALRQRVCADGRSAADGRDQYPDRAAAYADPPRHHAADGADLRRTLFRCRRPHPRDFRCDLAVRLGAA